MNIQSIIVCGAGTMGRGIAELTAARGIPTRLYDAAPAALESARDQIMASWKNQLSKGRMSEADAARGRQCLTFVEAPGSPPADLIIEAIVENLEAKVSLLRGLGTCMNSGTIIASNTSSLSIGALQNALPRPERVLGMHFFNPAPIMKLVEIVRGPMTDPDLVPALQALAVRLGKDPVVCNDAPGFIVNRVARPFYLESLRIVERGGGGMEDLDRIAEATGFRMGPFRLMDLIGNDVNLAVTRSLYEAQGRPARLAPSPLQEEKVRTGNLGRKSGRGYYNYQN